MAKIKSISIDTETFSDRDLNSCGVYKYASSPFFCVLLFAYSVDGGEVQVVDLMAGQEIPTEILEALTDPSITKWAYNAIFERVCLSEYLRHCKREFFKGYGDDATKKYISPKGWKCTMTWAAYMGLPLSLRNVGFALNLDDKKMEEGKDLIRYFCMPCKPTATNGGRTRNLPAHAPDKWKVFKAYNKRDVEVEMSVQHKLRNFPVPEFVWEEYWLDQEINDRGIMLDIPLVKNAITFDERVRRELVDRLQQIMEVENPNSVQQMKEWLRDNGLEMESLGKKEVAAVLKTAPPDIAEVLRLRQQLSKSSVKKYQAMQKAVCRDGRARGMFQFYGANRSGRWCLTGDHEILTPEGWRRLDEWEGGFIACWNSTSNAVSFQKANQLEFDYSGTMYHYKDSRIDQVSTPDHKMRVQKRFGDPWSDMTVEEMSHCRPAIPMNGYRYHRGCANPAWLRVLIMTQADGFYVNDGGVGYSFKKKRKIERCKQLLRKAEISFAEKVYKEVTKITIPARAVPLWLRQFRTKTFGYWLLDENPDIFFDELPNWDGYYAAPNSIQYSTCNKQNADIVQALAHMSGRCANIRVKKRDEKHSRWKDAYIVDIWLTPGEKHEIRTKPDTFDYSGKVYCAETTTGYFLVRRGGKVWVTGNSGRLIQLQNLPQNHMPDLNEARELIRNNNYNATELLYEDIPSTLSELIRTAFIPKPGYKFIVADFSAIEARVLSWLAKEQWRMDTFASGGDIYCATASKMFHCNVVKHGENGHLRQKGKSAELACGYGGSVGAMKAMGALESGMQEDELKPLVDAWREANPNIVKLWYAVDSAAKKAVQNKTTAETHGIKFIFQSGMLFIELPSGRRLSYVKPMIGENQFGGQSVTYMGQGIAKKWERIETFSGKLVENITQAIARDILCFAMNTLKNYRIVATVHDEIIIECPQDTSIEFICKQMSITPPWAEGLVLNADGYECQFYKKD